MIKKEFFLLAALFLVASFTFANTVTADQTLMNSEKIENSQESVDVIDINETLQLESSTIIFDRCDTLRFVPSSIDVFPANPPAQ